MRFFNIKSYISWKEPWHIINANSKTVLGTRIDKMRNEEKGFQNFFVFMYPLYSFIVAELKLVSSKKNF